MTFFRHDASIEKLRRGLRSHPPRAMHAHLPLDTQLTVAHFTLQLRFTMAGIPSGRLPGTATPTVELELPDILMPASFGGSGSMLLDAHDSHTVDLVTIQTAAWNMVHEAHSEDKLLTNDEMAALEAARDNEESDRASSCFAIRLPTAAASDDEEAATANQWSDVMETVDLLDHPDVFARWLRQQVMQAFLHATEQNTCLPATTTFLLDVETLRVLDRPFHLALYLESSTSNDEPFDSAAWKRYVHLLQVRARRQAAEGAFYGSLRALREEPVLPTSVGPKPPVWRRRKRREAKQQQEQLKGRESDQFKALRSRLDMATSEKTTQIDQHRSNNNSSAATEAAADMGVEVALEDDPALSVLEQS